MGRIHSSYNNETLDSQYASATAIRKASAGGKFHELNSHMPDYSFNIMKQQFDAGMGPVFLDNFAQPVLCSLRRMSEENISRIMDVNEGLEYKIKKAALISGCLEELIQNIKSKRYTETRIRRILIHSLLGMYKEDLKSFSEAGGPQYIRVLGFSNKGRELLSRIKKHSTLPVIVNTSSYKLSDNPVLKKMIEFDILSTDIYVTAYRQSPLRKGGYDFYRKPIML
jgi:predicted nucleotidyltransferase